jgi:hypothetical protein
MSGKQTQTGDLTLEHRILIQVRQVLASVVRDVTPPPGMRNPLSASTIEGIRDCFSLISARERELNSDKPNRDLPVYADRAATTHIVDFKPPADSGSEDD